MKVKITGEYSEQDWYGQVCIDGQPLFPEKSQQVSNISPDGFAWGYDGAGPTQLALAILLETGSTPEAARDLAPAFRSMYLAKLGRSSFELDVNVDEWAKMMRFMLLVRGPENYNFSDSK